MIGDAKVDTINVIDFMIMTFKIMWLYDYYDNNVVDGVDNDNEHDDDDDYNDDSNDDSENYNDNENDMNDDDNDPYKKVLVEVNKPSFATSSNIKMCSIIVISYACLKL